MIEPIIEVGFHSLDIQEVTVTIDWYVPPRTPNPTDEEIANCPDKFRCFLCSELKGKKKQFAGEIRQQRICKACFPYADDARVRGLISFDLKHGFPVRGYPKAKFHTFRKPRAKPLDPEIVAKLEASKQKQNLLLR